MINLKINGIETAVEEGSTILEAARSLNIDIPTLCDMKLEDFNYDNVEASCRVCMVELGWGKLVPACSEKVREGMEVLTDTERVHRIRKTIVELLLANHPSDCLFCDRNLNCELQTLAHNLGIREIGFSGEKKSVSLKDTNPCISRDPKKCVLCNRCVTMCNQVQEIGAISNTHRGFDSYIGTSFDRDLGDSSCTYCGQCVAVCPTGALTEVSNIDQAWQLLRDKNKHVLVQTAPAVRVALGEDFGLEAGSNVKGQMVTSLRRLGFDGVFDTNFAADLTIMEEAHEFISRFKTGENLPIMTSCCPGWVNFLEEEYEEFLHLPSSCKSPHQMLGAISKTYYAKKMDLDPRDIALVSIMPCIAKKYESGRSELGGDYGQDVDLVLTSRELARMIKEAGLDFLSLEESDFDNPLGESTGAGTIFGATGGVLEATLRTSYDWITGRSLEKIDFEDLRGFDGIKEAEIDIDGQTVRVAVVSGLANAREILSRIDQGEVYHAIEVMACPGGCIAGGGQPYHGGDGEILRKRREAIYGADQEKKLRKSHENPMIKELYSDYLGEPGSRLAHELLHTSYKGREDL